MAYTNSPATSVTDRLRLNVGDIHSVEILDDATYTYYYTKNEQNERRATRDLFTVLLFALSRYTQERAGQLEVYGHQYFQNYLSAVKLAITNPSIDFWKHSSRVKWFATRNTTIFFTSMRAVDIH